MIMISDKNGSINSLICVGKLEVVVSHFWFITLQAARVFESQLAESILEGDGQLAFKKLATATLETLMPRIEGKGEFGQARWRLVYAPQIPSLLSVDPSIDPLKSLANNISFGTEVEVQLGKRLQVLDFPFFSGKVAIIYFSMVINSF